MDGVGGDHHLAQEGEEDGGGTLPLGFGGALINHPALNMDEPWQDDNGDSDMDSGDDDMLDELDEELPNSLVCYVCFRSKKAASAKQQTIANLFACQDYRHPTKIHRACIASLKDSNTCIYCQPDILELGDLGLCKLVVQMSNRSAADRDVLYRALFEIIRLTNTSTEHVVKLHEFGACNLVVGALGARPSDLPFCLRAVEAVTALCQLPPERITDQISVGDSSECLCDILRTHGGDSEACLKTMTCMTKVAEVLHRNVSFIEQGGGCPLILEAMRRHKDKHAVQMAGMEAIRALSKRNLRGDSTVVQTKLPGMFIETMLRYGKDRSIQLFCLEALGDLSIDAESAAILGEDDACRASCQALAYFRTDAEIMRSGIRVLSKLGGNDQANREKLLRLESATLVARAVKGIPKDRVLFLEAMRTTYCLCSGGGPTDPTAGPSSAAFGDAGMCDAILAALQLFADLDCYVASAMALSALAATCEANAKRLVAASAMSILEKYKARLGIKEPAILQHVETLTKILEAATHQAGPPAPVRRGSQPPVPVLSTTSSDGKSQSLPHLSSPTTNISPRTSPRPVSPRHDRRTSGGGSSSTTVLPAITSSRPTSPEPTGGAGSPRPRSAGSRAATLVSLKDGNHAAAAGGNGSGDVAAMASTLTEERQRSGSLNGTARSPSSTLGAGFVAATPSSTVTETHLLRELNKPSSTFHATQLQAGLQRLAENEAHEAEENLLNSTDVSLPSLGASVMVDSQPHHHHHQQQQHQQQQAGGMSASGRLVGASSTGGKVREDSSSTRTSAQAAI